MVPTRTPMSMRFTQAIAQISAANTSACI